MRNKLGFGGAAFWIGLPLGLLVVLVIAFIIYKEANPSDNIWVQLWNYLESGTLNVVAAGLIIPIILLVLESRFKIVEAIKQNRLVRERRRREEARERRWECIERTSHMWNQLWSITSEVAHYRKSRDKERAIEDLLTRLDTFPSSAEDVVNMWYYRFPNLTLEDTSLFLVFINTLLDCARTVAYCIQESENSEEISKLQDSLTSIQSRIKTAVHHPMIYVLKDSMELLELRDAGESSDKEQKIVSRIKGWLYVLRNVTTDMNRQEKKRNKILSFVDGKEVEAFRKASGKFEDWIRAHPNKNVKDFKGYGEFKRLYDKMACEKCGLHQCPTFSKEYVIYLGGWLGFQDRLDELIQRAQLPE